MMTCAGFDPNGGLSETLIGLDCRMNTIVAGGYTRLFGPDGAFDAALTSALTIFVLLIGYGLMTGRMRLSVPSMTPKIVTLALVLTFATAWPAYQAVIYGLLMEGPDRIASVFMGAAGQGGAAQAFAIRLDRLFEVLTEMGSLVAAAGDPTSEAVKFAAGLARTSGITILLVTVGLLVISRIVLALLLALGPLFVVLALFKATRGLFEAWLRTSVGFAFVPMLAVLGGAGLITMIEPMIGPIADNPAAAVEDPRALIILFVTVMVYAALMPLLGFVGLSLTRGWRTGGGPPANPGQSQDRAETATVALATGGAGSMDGRVSELVAAVMRSDGNDGTAAAAAVQERAAAANDASSRSLPIRSGRTAGLGQSFRAPPQTRMLSGKVGS